MRGIRDRSRSVVAGLTVVLGIIAPQGARGIASEEESGTIEMAIVLDTSDSMKPLIDSVRIGLWDIVNELARLEPVPDVRVALVGFGGREEGPENGWVRVREPFTSDLDRFSAQLFELTTGGGTEYVARAVSTAVTQLAWSPQGLDAVRLIVIAGNEAADQDPSIDLLGAGRTVETEGIQLRAIFCGQSTNPDAEGWREMTKAAGGEFTTLDLSGASNLQGTPYDNEMVRLGRDLNATYVPWGALGKTGRKVQASQDRKVAKLSPAAAAARAETKAGALYEQEWDLVGAVISGRLDLASVAPDSLPRALRNLTTDELATWMQVTWRSRQELQKRILALGEQRRQYLGEQARARGAGGPVSFEAIVRQAIRQELEARGFQPESD